MMFAVFLALGVFLNSSEAIQITQLVPPPSSTKGGETKSDIQFRHQLKLLEGRRSKVVRFKSSALGFDDVHDGVCPAGDLISMSKSFHDVGCDFADWDSRYDVSSMADSSMPWLHDVFVDSTQQTVRFVLSNRKLCIKGCACADGGNPGACKKTFPCSTTACEKLSSSFNFFDANFTCEFSSGDVVTSHKTQTADGLGNMALLVQCSLPAHLQDRTDVRVNLVAPALDDGRERKLNGLPLCSSMARRNVHHYNTVHHSSTVTLAQDSKAFAPLSHKQFDLGVCLWLTADQTIEGEPWKGALWRLQEWLEHHEKVGVGHFFVYDNSKQPSVEMARILEPFVKSGRATLVHWPQNVCRRQAVQDKKAGFWVPPVWNNQFTMDLSCLQRFGDSTKLMAFIDVDEFLVPSHDSPTIDKTVQSVLAESRADADSWEPAPVLTRKCSAFRDQPSKGKVRAQYSCTKRGMTSNPKIIVNPDRVMVHTVHYAVRTWNGTRPSIEHLPADKLMMVHMREDEPAEDESWQPSDQVERAVKQFM